MMNAERAMAQAGGASEAGQKMPELNRILKELYSHQERLGAATGQLYDLCARLGVSVLQETVSAGAPPEKPRGVLGEIDMVVGQIGITLHSLQNIERSLRHIG